MNNQVANTANTANSPMKFDGSLLLYIGASLMMAVMVATSAATYFGWLAAVPLGIALTYVFGRLVKIATAPRGEATVAWRVGAVAMAILVFGATMGLSYATIYARLFAVTSALDNFQKVRLPAQHQLDSLVGHAMTAAKAMESWNSHSSDRAKTEASGGGTCPAKAASLGKRGPIAMFREGEAAIAADLYATVYAEVNGIATKLAEVKAQRPADYQAMMRFTRDLNTAIEQAETLAHGSLVKTALDTLQRQSEIKITWPNGETFECGDVARNELLMKARSAFTELSKAPALTPLAPAIDLSNPQATATRGLLRSYNSIAAVFTVGAAGQFGDDPLMLEALKKGVINQETLGMMLAALFEFLVTIASALQSRRGSAPFPITPATVVASCMERVANAPTAVERARASLLLVLAKTFFNLTYATTASRQGIASAKAHAAHFDFEDPAFPAREVTWGINRLAPYMVSLHDGDYVCVPAGANPRASIAARALAFSGAVSLMNTQVPWSAIATNRIAAQQLQKIVPRAYGMSWEVYKLTPSFAQALRIELLK